MAIPNHVVNPFSPDFLQHWDLWKLYKEETHSFKYKGVISEQMALKQLVDLSEGDEQKAVKIIEQSIRRQWQGLFPLHETTSPNGKSRAKKSASGTAANESGTLRERVAKAVNKRYGNGEQEADGSHLKVV